MKIFKYISIFLLSWVSIHLIIMVTVGFLDNQNPTDLIIIYGNKVEENGQPSERLKSRLNKGIEVYQENKNSRIIVSGAKGKEGYEEAEVMKDYLVENEIPEENIVVDNNGINTYETTRFIKKYVEGNNIEKVTIVTHYYHVLRAKTALRKAGMKEVYSVSSKRLEFRDFYSIPREIVGYYSYLFKDYS